MADRILTGIEGGSGYWPPPPSALSYSALAEIERCPRRWMLRHGRYPDLWSRPGYPDNPFLATLRGNVSHAALEVVVRAIATHVCNGHAGPCRVSVLRELGGYSVVLQAVLETTVTALAENPRVAARVGAIRRALTQELPELRRGLQTTIARTQIVARFPRAGNLPSGHRALGVGSHTEVQLRVPSLSWVGKADLITIDRDVCRITDYKTGAPQQGHEEQLRIYALLWARDPAVNPSGRLATELVASYATHDEVVPAPGPDELAMLEADLRTRSALAMRSLGARPPHANPEADLCYYCPVRQLCADYWEFLRATASSEDATPSERAVDVELAVRERNGPRSWLGVVRRGLGLAPETAVVLRSDFEESNYPVGGTVRILNVAVARDDASGVVTVSTSGYSEVFRVGTLLPS